MPDSPIPAAGAPQPRVLGRTRALSLIVLLAALALCIAVSWKARDTMASLGFVHNGGRQSLVDLRPWQTAQTLAALAVTSEEKQYAREAEHLADHEVDDAFAAALRNAELETRHRVLTGASLALSQHVAALQQVVARDNATVDRLKAAQPAASGKNPAASAEQSDALQLAEAQLSLDTDNLTDAQHQLDRATGDQTVQIQNELAAHQAATSKPDDAQSSATPIAIVSAKSHRTLAARIAAWIDQRSRYASLSQAEAEAQSDVRALTTERSALEAQADAAASGPVTLAALQDRTITRQILAIDDDRIQTDQQLASVYQKWGGQILLQHRIVLYLILQSVEAIVFILLCMILGDALVRRLMAHPSLERRQIQTLRTVLEVGVQVLGIALIVLVIFGMPRETATMIGLATAALTIALQDYILAFLGWFVLIGKNGIRVGDMVEINGVCGEVIELGLFSTALLETTGLAEKGEPTGRRVSFLNGYAIRGQFLNFSSEGQWLWDEITVRIPAGEDVYEIAKRVETAAREETQENARRAEQEWKRGSRVTGLTRLSAEPVVVLRPNDPNGIDIQVRYVTRASSRAEVRDRLYRQIIELFQARQRVAAPQPVG